MSEQRNNTNIQGAPLDLETMLDFAEIDIADIESAILFWDENASDVQWVGALDSEPLDNDTT